MTPPPPALPLEALCREVRLCAVDVSGQPIDGPLIGARLMDLLRDVALPPLPLAKWLEATAGFDEEAWRRLDIIVRLVRESAVAPALRSCLEGRLDAADALLRFCTREVRLLTLELLLKSPFRVEELARKWLAAFGGRVEGESPQASRARLERLDFGNVLKNLEAADQDRAQRLKKLQEIEAARLKAEQEAYQRAGRE